MDVLVVGLNNSLKFAVKDVRGAARNLSGYTARVLWSLNGRAQEARSASVTSPSLGYVDYTFTSMDLTESGLLVGELEITSPGGVVEATQKTFKRQVRARVGT